MKKQKNLSGTQPIGQRLEPLGCLAGQNPIVKRLVDNPLLVELTLEPFMTVEAYLQRIGGITAHLDKGRTKVLIDQIEVVVIYTDTLARVVRSKRAPTKTLDTLEGRTLLLGHTHQIHPLGRLETPAVLGCHVIFALPSGKMEDPETQLPSKPFDCILETCGDSPQQGRGGNRVFGMVPQKRHQLPGRLKLGDVPIEIETVQTLHRQGHMLFEEFVDCCHGTIMYSNPKNPNYPANRWSV